MPHAPSALLSQRHHGIRRAMSGASLDALVVLSLPNIGYLTNFAGSSAALVITPARLYFLTDSRYSTVVRDMAGTPHECPDLELVLVDGSYDATLATVVSSLGTSRIGFEAAHLTVSRFTWLQSALKGGAQPFELLPSDGLVELARSVKDAYELEVFRTAGAMLTDVTAQVLGLVRAGMTERELAWEVDTAIRRRGFEKSAFETIVAAGPNAALPHARPSGRTIGEGDLVVLDFGGVYDSYCVDLTRTVVVGTASARVQEVYAAVREAHDRAVAASRPGVSRFTIDAAARDVLERAGMGKAFGHGTGHGLGLEIHEDPRISKRGPNVDQSRETLVPGMVFTIEPGAYFPGWGGIRIEDDLLLTEQGAELLTTASTDLVTV